jgi:hypothetical protein
MWNVVAVKEAPTKKQEVFCAWQPYVKTGSWRYEVLIHWPDGVWTDITENEVEVAEMPTYWQDIQRPAWQEPSKVSNVNG